MALEHPQEHQGQAVLKCPGFTSGPAQAGHELEDPPGCLSSDYH